MFVSSNLLRDRVPLAAGAADAQSAEIREFHTGILRLTLAIEHSRRYWEHVDPPASLPPPARAAKAFEQRWFGSKSLERVRYLTTTFAARYDAFPASLRVLAGWRDMDPATRQLICHWHVQLTDPLYRRFSGSYLVSRRVGQGATIDRDAVLRWIRAEYPDRWSEATCVQFASKLLSAAREAGLVGTRDPRPLAFPRVGDQALAYLLYLLRHTRFDGDLTGNPYLVSVGVDEDWLVARARSLPGVSLRRMMGVLDFEWAYPDLAAWRREVVS